MINKVVFIILIFFVISSNYSEAQSCKGKGTVIFFGNGMFNTEKEAQESKHALISKIKGSKFFNDSKETIIFDSAYKRNEPVLEQLLNVAAQKGVTEFEHFWAWISSLEVAPVWFREATQGIAIKVFNVGSRSFPDHEEHFDAYSKYIQDGYNVILVSHSQGNFYANQVMRKLENYTGSNLLHSVNRKINENQLFPKFFDIFSNVQVATPVSHTVNSSPWTTFKDDLVIAAVRNTLGSLPDNLSEDGSGKPPIGDLLGHNFVKAYLRVDESSNKILQDIKSSYNNMRYPIAYCQRAVLLEQDVQRSLNTKNIVDLSFTIHAKKDGGDLQMHQREQKQPGIMIDKDFLKCFELPIGDTRITAETVLDGVKEHEFNFKVWPEGQNNIKIEKPLFKKITAKGHGSMRWDIGVIHAKEGKAKEPLEVNVEIFPEPILIKK